MKKFRLKFFLAFTVALWVAQTVNATELWVGESLACDATNRSVAYVNASGLVNGVGEGDAVVTATAERGGYTADCRVGVLPKPTHFIVCLKGGKTVAYALDGRPQVAVNGSVVTLTDKTSTVEYPLADVVKYLLGKPGEDSSINSLTADSGKFRQSAGILTLSGFSAGAKVAVYGVGGSMAESLAIGSDGRLEVSLAGYPAGVYIVNVESRTFKFFKR